MDVTNLPRKMYFRIGEVSNFVGVDPHVLRYWETEFDQVAPPKGKGGQRMYRREDVLLLMRIKDLLYNQGYTIEGARRALTRRSSEEREEIIATLSRLAHRLSKYRSVGA